MKVTIYTKTTCPYCVLAKNWFTEHNIDYEEINFSKNPEKLKQFKLDNPTAKTVPQIFVDNELIGGHDDLMARSSEVLNLVKANSN
jgi:glutaredoxin